MNKNKSNNLDSILKNKISGSSELVQMLNDYFRYTNKSKTEILSDIQKSKAKLGHFEAVDKYLNKLKMSLGDKETLDNFLMKYSEHQKKNIEKICTRIYPLLKNKTNILTISRSGTVFEVLKLLHKKNHKLKVVVCESRPKLEGRLLARDLAKSGIKTELITDAMMSLFIPKVDAALFGADIILKNRNIVNKVGSKSLALLCKESNKPIFVIATKSKVSRESIFSQKKENSEEVLNKSIKNLSVSNFYFEEIDRKYITKIITD